MTSDAVVALQSVLVPGEHVLWSGRPGVRFRRGEVIVSAIVAVVALLAAYGARQSGGAALVAVFFAAVALWGLVPVSYTHLTLPTTERV